MYGTVAQKRAAEVASRAEVVWTVDMSHSISIRRQVTLFLNDSPTAVEYCRRTYNPVQASLIAAHVTLCREDEIADWKAFENRVATLDLNSLRLKFGEPVRDGDLVLLPVITGADKYNSLRDLVLSGTGVQARQQNAHVTIIHPRNGKCTDEVFAEIRQRLEPFESTFTELSLIEQQVDGPWKTLSRYRMRPT